MKLLLESCFRRNVVGTFEPGKELSIRNDVLKKSDKQKHYRYWTLDDDEKLSKIAKEKNYDWRSIAEHFTGRTPADVEQRWRQRIDPKTKKSAWSKEEDQILYLTHKKLGGKWKIISEYLPGRLPSSIKNRFYGKIFKQVTKQVALQKPLMIFEEIDEIVVENFLDLSENETECTDSGSCAANQENAYLQLNPVT